MAKLKDIGNMPLGDQHRALVGEINEMYPNYFPKQHGLVYSNEVEEKISWKDARHLAILTYRLYNFQGATMGEINLYELFDAYFRDAEKRRLINDVIHAKGPNRG